MNKNLEIYDAVRQVPEEAKKTIRGGRLNGMTDINPMWRIKTLTDRFGPCGIGWYTEMYNKEIYPVGDEIVVSVDVLLYIKYDGEWSMGINGTGGAKLCVKEKNGLFIDDEAFKKAETDAISVCCKKLGVGADVYWGKDGESKYTAPAPKDDKLICEECGGEIRGGKAQDGSFKPKEAVAQMGKDMYGKQLCAKCLAEKMNGNEGKN